jgi:hypothetical protein
MKTDFILSLNAVYPQIAYTVADKAYDINKNEISYDVAQVQAHIDANAYKDKRAVAYPSITDQLDLLYHGGMDVWKAAITAVKEEFPK